MNGLVGTRTSGRCGFIVYGSCVVRCRFSSSPGPVNSVQLSGNGSFLWLCLTLLLKLKFAQFTVLLESNKVLSINCNWVLANLQWQRHSFWQFDNIH